MSPNDATPFEDAPTLRGDSSSAGGSPRASDEQVQESIDGQRLKASLFSKLFDAEPATVKVGRYRILDEIGAGGMGQVFSAYDEELDRKVAIKVVHSALSSESARSRLRREAQALGRLTHPNVVTVHEIGDHNGEVFVAMEFIRGLDLRKWREAEARTVTEVLSVYLQAARGLAAAHEAGIVHRDFKPDNAIYGDDRRVRVVDFGLARGLGDPDPDPAVTVPERLPTEHDARDDVLDTPLTVTGSVLGTPAYMAPEQLRAQTANDRTDQFSFCVTLWEAVYQQRPFAGTTFAELSANVAAGARQAPPRGVVVPGAIRAALETGLSVDPSQRHANMGVLVDVLERELRPQRSRWWIPATVIPVVAVAGFALTRNEATGAQDECVPAPERLAGVWDDAVRARLAAKFNAADEHAFVANTWASLERSLDGLTGRWTTTYEGACAAIHAPDPAARRLAAQRFDCLDAGLMLVDAVAKEADARDPVEYARAFKGVVRQPGLVTCDSDAFVRSLPAPPPAATLADVSAVRAELAVATASMASGQGRPALEAALQALPRARDVAFDPLIAEALGAVALARCYLQDPDCRATLNEALNASEASGHDPLTVQLLYAQIEVAQRLKEPHDHIIERAQGVIERQGSPVEARLALASVRANGAVSAQQWELAEALAESIVSTYGEDPRVPTLLRADAYGRLAVATGPFGDPQVRLDAATRAAELVETELGVGHPGAVGFLDNAAYALFQLGRPDEAVVAYDTLIAGMHAAYPEGHPRLGWLILQRARALDRQGRTTAALAGMRESEAMLTQLFGPNHSAVLRGPSAAIAGVLLVSGDDDGLRARVAAFREAGFEEPATTMLGAVVDALDGKPADARASLAKVIALLPPKPMTEQHEIWLVAAYTELLLGDMDAAHAHAEQGLKMPRTADVFGGSVAAMAGFLRTQTGDAASAIPLLEEAHERLASAPNPESLWYAALAHYGLAVALQKTGGDHDRAVGMVRTAVRISQDGLAGRIVAEKATAWLAEHDG